MKRAFDDEVKLTHDVRLKLTEGMYASLSESARVCGQPFSVFVRQLIATAHLDFKKRYSIDSEGE